MIREFGKPNETTPVIVDAKPLDNALRRDDVLLAPDTNEGMRPFHVEVDESESNNTAKIIGGVVVGLLIIGGGIYAYEFSRSVPVQQQVALKAPVQSQAPSDQAAAAPPPVTPDNSVPDNSAAPSATPASAPSSQRAIKSADDSAPASAAPAQQSAAADSAINAPMTLTPDTAPPPEQAAQAAPDASAGQTAMQQPVTAPDVSGQTNQPTPSVADNGPASPRTLTPQLPPQLQAPDASQTAPVPPAELPAAQAQDPNAQ